MSADGCRPKCNQRQGYLKIVTGLIIVVIGACALNYVLENWDNLTQGRQSRGIGWLIVFPPLTAFYGVWRLTAGIIKAISPAKIRPKSPW